MRPRLPGSKPRPQNGKSQELRIVQLYKLFMPSKVIGQNLTLKKDISITRIHNVSLSEKLFTRSRVTSPEPSPQAGFPKNSNKRITS